MKVYIKQHTFGAGFYIYRGYFDAWKSLGYEPIYYNKLFEIPNNEKDYYVMTIDADVKSEKDIEILVKSNKTFLYTQPNIFPKPWGMHPNFVSQCFPGIIKQINKLDNVKQWTFGKVNKQYMLKWKNPQTILLAFDHIKKSTEYLESIKDIKVDNYAITTNGTIMNEEIIQFLKEFPKGLTEFSNLLERNKIFMDRTVNCGPISAERALAYSFVGPNLRAAGVDYDVRVMNPYSSYEDFTFTVPVGTQGDTYDRFMVRQHEMWQSLSIIDQAIKKMPAGAMHADLPDFFLPPKEQVYNNMEALIYHFKIVMGETDIPKGEVYHCVEGGNGELGFYLISDGGRTPFRLHFRRPCFIYYQAYPEMIKGIMLSDAILTMSSMNVIAGELDA